MVISGSQEDPQVGVGEVSSVLEGKGCLGRRCRGEDGAAEVTQRAELRLQFPPLPPTLRVGQSSPMLWEAWRGLPSSRVCRGRDIFLFI